jgi:hypothetical protein
MALDRARALFNGFGYALGFSLLYALWASMQGSLEYLASGNLPAVLPQFRADLAESLISVIPGPILAPLAINLPARSHLIRGIYIVVAAAAMFVWCERSAGISYSWDWASVGYILYGFLTTALVVGVCAYYVHSQVAADALVRQRIERDRLRVEQTRAHLQLLQAQIEPHFLFNTLSVVRALAKSDRAATVAMLGHLIRYFEAALPRLRRDVVPLTEEFELVDAYLAIYGARMGARLAYRISAPSDLGGLMIPPMMLLTLVENALKHGVGPAPEGGFIHVSATRQGDSLSLKVANSGAGLRVCQGHGTGLANLRQRLLMTYGEKASLSLLANGSQGVVASISVPVQGAA